MSHQGMLGICEFGAFSASYFLLGTSVFPDFLGEMRVVSLTKEFPGKKAVSNLSFFLPSGKITGLLGPNGAGKTTTLRLLTGYLTPTSGEVWVDGKLLEKHRVLCQEKMGYLPENSPLYPELIVEEYLSFVAKSKGLRGFAKKRALQTTLFALDLDSVKKQVISRLSKGWKQRVALAGALINNPRYLILDEPSSGLDPRQMDGIRTHLKKIAKEKTILLSTHFLDEVESICDQVLILNQGRLVAHIDLEKEKNKELYSWKSVGNFTQWQSSLQSAGIELESHQETEIRGDYKFLLLGKGQRPEVILSRLIALGIPVREFQKEPISVRNMYQSVLDKEAL